MIEKLLPEKKRADEALKELGLADSREKAKRLIMAGLVMALPPRAKIPERVAKPGQVLPVLITIYNDKSFDFVIKTPPAAVLIMEAIKIQKGSKEPNRAKVGSISWDQIKKIAELKMPDLNAFKVESAMKMIAGTARSMGVTVSGAAPWNK